MNRAASMPRGAPSRRSKAEAVDARPARPVQTAKADRFNWLPWLFPAMLLLAGAGRAAVRPRPVAGLPRPRERDTEGGGAMVRHPIMPWVQRGISLLLVAASIERIGSHFLQRKAVPSPTLTWAFLAYWLTTVLTPAVFGAHPQISHEYVYSMLFGLAATLCNGRRQRILLVSRNGLFLYILAGMALVPVMPSLVLDTAYTQGLVPGLPRFGGLASHPVMMGMMTQAALLLLWTNPFARRWLNVAAWTLGLGVLFLAQSKTAWLAFLLSAAILLVVRRTPGCRAAPGRPAPQFVRRRRAVPGHRHRAGGAGRAAGGRPAGDGGRLLQHQRRRAADVDDRARPHLGSGVPGVAQLPGVRLRPAAVGRGVPAGHRHAQRDPRPQPVHRHAGALRHRRAPPAWWCTRWC
jgi:hypothetical protein